MNDKDYHRLKRAVRRFVENEPDLFVEAVEWVLSLKPKAKRSKLPEGSIACRTVEALVLHFRALLGQNLKTILDSNRVAFRVLITSWLLAEESHEPYLYGHDSLPKCLRRLPVLGRGEYRDLAPAHRLNTYPPWRRLVLAAMTAVADPGYLPFGPETAQALPQPVDRLPVAKDALAMLKLLCTLPEAEGRSGRELVRELSGKFPGIDEDRIRKLAQELEPYGVRNRRSAGYYVPLSCRPGS